MKRRLLSIATIVALLLTFMPLSILATSANVALTDITDKHPGDTVTVSGTSSYNEVIIKVIRPNTTVSYYDVAVPSNGIYSKSFTLPTDADLGSYTVIAGKDTNVATDTFAVTAATTASSNAKLKTLQVSEGTLVFSADQTDYSVSVGNSVSVVTVTTAADDTHATVKINSETTITKVITLNVGPNTVPIEVTAQDGVTQKTYNLTIKRAAAETAASGATISVTTEPVSITVGSGITDAKISVPNSSDGTARTATLPLVEVKATTSLGNVSVSIPNGTVVTAPDNWDGKIKLPEVQSNSSVTINNANVNSVIEIGSPSVTLTFNKAVRLLVPGQAGKSAGYVRGGVFHAITTTLVADNQTAADALPVGGEAKIDVGSDLVIWTKHFTQFVSYTAVTPTPAPAGGGGGGGGAVSTNTDIIYAASGGTVTLNGAKIIVPAGAVNGNISNFKVTVNKVTDTSILPIDSSSKLISDVFDISKDITGEFSKPVQITLPFDKNNVDMNLSTVSIYWFNEDTKKWIQLDNPQVDSDNNTVTGSVNHFTKFAVLATAKPAIPTLSDTKGHWAEKSIQEMIQMGSIKGYPDGTFKPDNNITRAEFVSIIVKAFKLKEQEGKVFADTVSHWAKKLIATAAANGIISGYSDTTFGPNDPITREQMAAIIVKAVQIEVVTEGKTYNDQLEISEWAKAAIATATSKGLMNGYQDGTLKPKGNSTRAEAVTVILRALPFNK
ncbi:ZU5 domain-containing protein [Paenibacillus sp. yr247]|uniref:S-layer homology domain-containing protein n=1 Tax=Paenibacillus sp. yr247 TaxID=1761880 RepID=UPI000882844C|nr:S-layer homology domain-containing protein [Paenibacillus sp. yr247]SDP04887.1 ZU5 domain-containing protein [Paenibacillus sp. yr247]